MSQSNWPSSDPRLSFLAAELGIPDDYPICRSLPYHPEAEELVVVALALDEGSDVRLSPLAAEAWGRLTAAAQLDGLGIFALSGFRSVERQAAIIRDKLKQGQTIAEILRLVAAPGFSEHHSGRALDVGSALSRTLTRSFGDTAEFHWLQRRAVEFGFILSYPQGNPFGFDYEPWHWCWWSATGRAGSDRARALN